VKRALGLHIRTAAWSSCRRHFLVVSEVGNTWTRFLLANLRFSRRTRQLGEYRSPGSDPMGHHQRDFDRMPRPRIIKTMSVSSALSRVLSYIVRDPRDVVVSQYHYHRKLKKIEDDPRLKKFVTPLPCRRRRARTVLGDKTSQPGCTRARANARFLLLRYEDLLADTARELARWSHFCNFPQARSRLAQAVERSSADRMRKLEKEQPDRNTLYERSRKDLSLSAPRAGGWRSDLPAPQAARIEAAWDT